MSHQIRVFIHCTSFRLKTILYFARAKDILTVEGREQNIHTPLPFGLLMPTKRKMSCSQRSERGSAALSLPLSRQYQGQNSVKESCSFVIYWRRSACDAFIQLRAVALTKPFNPSTPLTVRQQLPTATIPNKTTAGTFTARQHGSLEPVPLASTQCTVQAYQVFKLRGTSCCQH
jgi:hypothetical protein